MTAQRYFANMFSKINKHKSPFCSASHFRHFYIAWQKFCKYVDFENMLKSVKSVTSHEKKTSEQKTFLTFFSSSNYFCKTNFERIYTKVLSSILIWTQCFWGYNGILKVCDITNKWRHRKKPKHFYSFFLLL